MSNGTINGIEHRKKDSAKLRWDTKPKRAPNPKDIEFQTAEVVIPNPHRDEFKLPEFMEKLPSTIVDKSKMNRLIWGDNLLAMQALLAQGYEGRINMIYIDPPFWTGEDYYTNVVIGKQSVEQSPTVAQRLAFKDYWSGGIDSYLDVIYPRLQLMKRLLTPDGSIFFHIDYHIGPYVRVVLDEIFPDGFRNEIIVRRTQKNFIERGYVKSLNVAYDTVLLFARSEKTKFNPPYKDEKREETWHAFDAPNWTGGRQNLNYKLFGKSPPMGRVWSWEPDRAKKAIEAGTLRKNPRTGKPEYLIPARDKTLCTNLWDDINAYAFKYGYSTEKNEKFLERIINMGSKEGDLVADFYCGSGTTLAVAERLKRKWIGCDFSKTALQIARNRQVENDATPFLLENIGNYQRHLIYLSGAKIYEMQRIILKLYGATPRKDLPDMGWKKNAEGHIELIFVGYPDRPVTAKKVEELAIMADNLDGQGYKRLVILGWDYEYNYEELLIDRKKSAQTKWKAEIESKTIPPEVYDYLKTVNNEDEIEPFADKIEFHERPYLKLANPIIEKLGSNRIKVTVGLERYVLFNYPIHDEDKRQKIMEISQKDPLALVDYWAIDWNHDGITFKSVWQAFRGFGKDVEKVPKKATREFESGKRVNVAVRLVDIFGNDASVIQTIDLRRV